MKKLLLMFSCILIFSILLSSSVQNIYSDDVNLNDIGSINEKLNKLQQELDASKKATAPLESQVTNLKNQITDIENQVTYIEKDIIAKKKIIDNGYKDLAKQQDLLDRTVRSFYIRNYAFSPLIVFISSKDASNLTRTLAYQKREANKDKDIITNVALKISDLEKKKKALESEEAGLETAKARLAVEKQGLDKIVAGAKTYQSQLSSEIAQLSARQQDLIAQKLASLGLPTSAYTTKGGCSSDLMNGKDPGFSPRFALFTYGVPHRVGMSQYGAKGRADSGQNAETILKAYFNADYTTGYSTDINIHVTGTNEYGQSFNNDWNIEEYVKHIYEIPTGWNSEALKAQAIAARSYALSVTSNGANSICPSQECQVVKTELNDGSWQGAVDATRGIVMTNGGQPIKAWFSSTAGGYTFSSGAVWGNDRSWTKNMLDASGGVNNFGDLQNNAYDKSSPWFYCDWGARSQYSGTAWLKSEELADIVNVILLAKADSSTQQHLSQVDKPNPDGVDTWDSERVKQELKNKGITPFNNISDGSVSADFGGGKTNNVTLTGDGGSQSFNATDFKNFFNLRAPSNINIVGPLFNVEKR